MTDRDKVIKGFEHCVNEECRGCPYYDDCYKEDGFSVLARDALELLKAAELAELQIETRDEQEGAK